MTTCNPEPSALRNVKREAVFWCLLSEHAWAADARLFAWEQSCFYRKLAEGMKDA